MILSLKKWIFFLVFFIFQFLFIFTFSFSLQNVVIAFYVLFLALYFYLFRLKVVLSIRVLGWYLLFLVLLSVSSFFSHSLALSIDSLVFNFSAFLSFIFFHSFFHQQKYRVEKYGVWLVLLLFVISASLLFVSSLLLENFSNVYFSLPSLLILSFGHSHLAYLLLVIIPVAWWFYYFKLKLRFKFSWLLPVFNYLVLLLTFSRTAILLSLLSLPFLIKNSFFRKQLVKRIVVVLSFTVLMALFLVSLPTKSESCFTQSFKLQLCKPINKEVRLEYFRTALKGIRANFVFGYGPGTYSLVANRYSTTAKLASSFAHNFLLQLMAESGLVTGGVMIVVLGLFLQEAVSWIKLGDKSKIEYYLAISFIALLLNSLLDFDWNVFQFFQLALIVVAGFLATNRLTKLRQNLLLVFYYLVTGLVVLVGSLVLFTKAILADGLVNLAVTTYPYLHQEVRRIVLNKNLSDDNLNRLLYIYRYDHKVISLSINSISSNTRKLQLYSNLSEVFPWTYTNQSYLKLLKDSGKFAELGEVAMKAFTLLDQAERKGVVARYQKKEMLAYFLSEAANYQLSNGHPDLAAKYYQRVLMVDKLVLHKYDFFFQDIATVSIKDMGLFLSLLKIKESSLGRHRQLFYDWFSTALLKEYKHLSLDDLKLYQGFFDDYKSVIVSVFEDNLGYLPLEFKALKE